MKYVGIETFLRGNQSACIYRAKGPGTPLLARNLQFKMIFECMKLDENGMVISGDRLKPIGEWLGQLYNGTTCIADDDPDIETFRVLHNRGIIDLRVMPGIGPARFAEHTLDYVKKWLSDNNHLYRVTVRSVECEELGGPSCLCIE